MARGRLDLSTARGRPAYKLGLTSRGYRYYRGGGDLALAESSPGGLKRQATREIAAAYKPVQGVFNRRESQIKALDAKRQADEQVFNSWMQTQQAQIMSQAESRDAALRDLSAQHGRDVQARLEAIRGPVAGPAATTNQAAVTAALGSVATQQGTAEQGLIDRNQLGGNIRAAVASNNLAFANSLSAKRQADTYDALAKNREGADRALLQAAADHSRRVASLLQGETQKAQLRVAAQQFGAGLIQKSLDRQVKVRGQNVTARGQDLASQDRALARENQRWLKQHPTPAAKGVNAIKPGQRARAQAELGRALTIVKTDPHFQIGRGHAKKGGYSAPGTGLRLVNKLVRNGIASDIAQIAAFRLIYPNAKLTPNLRRIWETAQQRQANAGG